MTSKNRTSRTDIHVTRQVASLRLCLQSRGWRLVAGRNVNRTYSVYDVLTETRLYCRKLLPTYQEHDILYLHHELNVHE